MKLGTGSLCALTLILCACGSQADDLPQSKPATLTDMLVPDDGRSLTGVWAETDPACVQAPIIIREWTLRPVTLQGRGEQCVLMPGPINIGGTIGYTAFCRAERGASSIDRFEFDLNERGRLNLMLRDEAEPRALKRCTARVPEGSGSFG